MTVQVWRAEWRGDVGRWPDGGRPGHGPGALAVLPSAPGQRAHCACAALHILYCGCFNRKWISYFHIFHVSFMIMFCFQIRLFDYYLFIFFIFSTKSLRTSSNLLILQLAILDFIMMAKAPIFIYNSAMRGFATGTVGCQLFALMGSYSGIGAGMTNACIAYDR